MKIASRLSVLFALLLMLAVVAACSGKEEETAAPSPSTPTESSGGEGTAPPAEPEVYPDNGLPVNEQVTVKIGFWESGYGRQWFDVAMQKFSERYPNVKFDVTSSPALDKILEPKVAANDDNEMFDLFYPSFSGSETMRELRNAGKIATLNDLLDRELIGEEGKTLRSVLPESSLFFDTDGSLYSLPMGSYSAGLFYNENLFNEKGWNKNPKTWDEFVALLDSIKQDGVTPITFPGIYPEYLTNFVFDLVPWTLAAEQGKFEEYESYYGAYGYPVYTHEYVKEQYNRIYDFGQKGYFPSGVAALNHTQSQMQVLQGRAAMVASGDWIGNEMKDATPEGFVWGFMAMPASNDPSIPIYIQSAASTNSMIVWNNRPELAKSWAKEFLLFLYDFDVLKEMAGAGIYPTRLDFGDDPARIESLDIVPKAVASYAAQNNVVFYEPKRLIVLGSSAASQALKVISEGISAIASGTREPLPILEKADEYMKTALDEQR